MTDIHLAFLIAFNSQTEDGEEMDVPSLRKSC